MPDLSGEILLYIANKRFSDIDLFFVEDIAYGVDIATYIRAVGS